MTSLKVADLVELRAPPNTCINPLLENEEFLTLAAGAAAARQGRGACHCEQQ